MATNIIMPKLGFDMSAGKIVRWLKQIGDAVRKGEAVLEIETDKATVEVVAEADGLLSRILAQPGADVPVGEAIGEINGASSAAPAQVAAVTAQAKPSTLTAAAQAASAATEKPAAKPAMARIEASPLAKRLAAEQGIDLQMVKGSGPNGRITKEDIETYVATRTVAAPTPVPAPMPTITPVAPVVAPAAPSVGYGAKPLSRMRQTIARRMAESKGPVPQFYLTTEVDAAACMAMVNQMLEAGKAEDLRPSPMNFVMKACTIALRKYPNLNASFGGDKIVLHEAINIGVAVAVEGGLMTPVIPNCDQKSIAQIAREVRAAAERARSGKLSPADLTPGTFSVSNLGMFDIEHFVAIINPPEAAILAIGMAKEVPVVEQGQIKIGVRMKLTLSADHRVTDGAEAARFLKEIKTLVQTPMSLML